MCYICFPNKHWLIYMIPLFRKWWRKIIVSEDEARIQKRLRELVERINFSLLLYFALEELLCVPLCYKEFTVRTQLVIFKGQVVTLDSTKSFLKWGNIQEECRCGLASLLWAFPPLPTLTLWLVGLNSGDKTKEHIEGNPGQRAAQCCWGRRSGIHWFCAARGSWAGV